MFKNKFLIFFYLVIFYGSSQDILSSLSLRGKKTDCNLPFSRLMPIDQGTISQLQEVLSAGCNRETVKKMLKLYPGCNVIVYTGRAGTSYVVSDLNEFRTDSPTVRFEVTDHESKDRFMRLQAAQRTLICNYLRTERIVIGDDDAERIAFLNRDDVQNLTWFFHVHTYNIHDKKDLLDQVLRGLKNRSVSEIIGTNKVKKDSLFGDMLTDFLRSNHDLAIKQVGIPRGYFSPLKQQIVRSPVPVYKDPRLYWGSYRGLSKPLTNNGKLLTLEPKAADVKAGRKSQENLDSNKKAALAVEHKLRTRMVADQNFIDMPLD